MPLLSPLVARRDGVVEFLTYRVGPVLRNYGVYLVGLALFGVFIFYGIERLGMSLYYAETRSWDMYTEAIYEPGPQPDLTAKAARAAAMATLQTAYSAVFFSLASLTLGFLSLYHARSNDEHVRTAANAGDGEQRVKGSGWANRSVSFRYEKR